MTIDLSCGLSVSEEQTHSMTLTKPETCLELCPTSKIEHLAKLVNGF